MMATVLVLMSNTHPESKSAREITVRDNIQQSSVSNDPTVEVFFILFDRFLQLADLHQFNYSPGYIIDCNWN